MPKKDWNPRSAILTWALFDATINRVPHSLIPFILIGFGSHSFKLWCVNWTTASLLLLWVLGADWLFSVGLDFAIILPFFSTFSYAGSFFFFLICNFKAILQFSFVPLSQYRTPTQCTPYFILILLLFTFEDMLDFCGKPVSYEFYWPFLLRRSWKL